MINNASIADLSKNPTIEEISSYIDTFIMADEFKANEREKLMSLPEISVDILTDRLNKMSPGDPGEIRIFESLSVKLRQFKRSISTEAKSAALLALETKASDSNAPFNPYRIQLIEELKKEFSNISEPHKPSQRENIHDARTPINPSKKENSTNANHDGPQVWPWIAVITALVASLAFFLKRKLQS